MKPVSPDLARISFAAGDSFYEIAQVQDAGREQNLNQAIAAYLRALEVYILAAYPVDYALTQNNLGNAYSALAEVLDKKANLGKAIAAYQEALRVRTHAAYSVQYAATQPNLGAAYLRLA